MIPVFYFSILFFDLVCNSTSHICPPGQYLAEAVPEDEEDYPCCFALVYHSQSIQKTFVRCKHGGGVNIEIARVILGNSRLVVFTSYIRRFQLFLFRA